MFSPQELQIIWKYKECLSLLWAINELRVPAFISPDEMGEVVDGINTMFDGHHSITLSGDFVNVPISMFESVAFFIGSLI